MKGWWSFFYFVTFLCFSFASEDLECHPTGDCIKCLEEELQEPYCLSTNYRQEFYCPQPKRSPKSEFSGGHLADEIQFLSCHPSARSDTFSVLVFEMSTLIVFFFAFTAVIERKKILVDLQQRRIQSMIAV